MSTNRRLMVPALAGMSSILLSSLSGHIFDGDAGGLDYYIDDRIGDLGNMMIALLTPVLVGFVTWEVGKLRDSKMLYADAARSTISIVIRSARPMLIVSSIVFVSLHTWHIAQLPTTVRGVLGLMLPYVILLSVCLFWSAVAVRIHRIIVVPSSVIFTWFAVAYLPATDWKPARHLMGIISGCCNASEALSVRAIGGSTAVATGGILIGLSLLSKK